MSSANSYSLIELNSQYASEKEAGFAATYAAQVLATLLHDVTAFHVASSIMEPQKSVLMMTVCSWKFSLRLHPPLDVLKSDEGVPQPSGLGDPLVRSAGTEALGHDQMRRRSSCRYVAYTPPPAEFRASPYDCAFPVEPHPSLMICEHAVEYLIKDCCLPVGRRITAVTAKCAVRPRICASNVRELTGAARVQRHNVPLLQPSSAASLDDVDLAHGILSEVIRPESRPDGALVGWHVRNVGHQKRSWAKCLLGLQANRRSALVRGRQLGSVIHAYVHLAVGVDFCQALGRRGRR